MSITDRVLLLLDDTMGLASVGIRSVDPDSEHVSVLDLGVTRGDGIFEALDAING
ncbi:MAG: aminodeoxychorismate lyase, partial [Glaciihabitans sp.]|nr:aminodeoxychorismate lyase [Glaciihabitans sp.]